MPDVQHSFDVGAAPREVLDFMLDDAFANRLKGRLKRISHIEPGKLEEMEDGRLRRSGRFTAPTELPRPLRRWEDKAPDEVHWDEIWHIDPETFRIDTEIVADVPDHWHDYYDNRGQLHISPIGEGRSRVRQQLTFDLNAPLGLGMFLNRSIKGVIDDMFEAYEAVVVEEFGT